MMSVFSGSFSSLYNFFCGLATPFDSFALFSSVPFFLAFFSPLSPCGGFSLFLLVSAVPVVQLLTAVRRRRIIMLIQSTKRRGYREPRSCAFPAAGAWE